MRVRVLMIRATLAACTLILAAGISRGQDPLAKSLGLTRDSGSMPVWAKPTPTEAESLTEFARKAREGILLVGDQQTGHGTAFVISRKGRLLATNAHVADIFFAAGARQLAIRNNTNVTYQVEKIWYHPGVLRFVGNQVVRSQDPKVGELFANCPDVAVLRLAPGPELPVEFEMATPEEIRDVFAMPVGMMGYPGYDTKAVPKLGELAVATFTQGIISRVTDFALTPNRPQPELQFLHHSMANWGGFSGSPIFLKNGHLVGLHNSAMQETGRNGEIRSLPHGVRVDCLWELIAFHGLDLGEDGVKLPIDKGQLLLDRYRKADPQVDRLYDAIKLVHRADRLKDLHRFDEAVQKCGEAIKLYPDYPRAYLIRSQTQTEFVAFNKDRLANKQTMDRLQGALDDINVYNKLAPSDHEGYIERSHVLHFGSYFMKGPDKEDLHKKAVGITNQLLEIRNMSRYDRCSTLSLASDISTDPKQKLAAANEALELYPYEKNCYLNRAYAYRAGGKTAEAQKDMARFQQLLDAEQESDRAWKLATATLAARRDGQEAVRIARKSCEATGWKNWRDLDVLAAAYAEAGDFAKAIECGERARDLAPPEKRPEAGQHLMVYRSGKPIRDEQVEG